MRRAIGIAVLAALILSVSGCANENQPQGVNESSVPEISASEIHESTAPDESSSVSFSESNESTTETAEPTENQQPPQETVSQPVSRESTEAKRQTSPPAAESNPAETEQPNTPKPQTTTERPETPAEEPPQETAPPSTPSETEAPPFDIDYWIGFAQDYAVSVGLRLESSAVSCWDNPITAGAHCIYLERDIQGTLNKYSRDSEITDVWIWAEKRSDGSYDLYIGYA